MLQFLKNNKKNIWWLVPAGLLGIAGLLLVPIFNFAVKLANRYPKVFEWVFIILCAFVILFINNWTTRVLFICIGVVFTSTKLSAK